MFMDAQHHLRELALRAVYVGGPAFTRFYEPAAFDDIRRIAREADVQVAFDGGYEGAEKRMAAFYAGDPPETFPIARLEITWNGRYDAPEHRDLLGSAMALGMERDVLGDICPGDRPGTAYLACTSDIAPYILANWERAGRAAIHVRACDQIRPAPPKGTYVRITVPALRLDAVVAAGWKLPRAQAQKLIAAELVKVNHVPQTKGDARVGEGDLISARGYGRMKLEHLQGQTRKGRLGAVVFVYG